MGAIQAIENFGRHMLGTSEKVATEVASNMKGYTFPVMNAPVPFAGGGRGVIPPRNITALPPKIPPIHSGGGRGGLPVVRPNSDIDVAWKISPGGRPMKRIGAGEGRTISSGRPSPTAPLALPAGSGAADSGFNWKDWAKIGAIGVGGVAIAGLGIGALVAGSYENQWQNGR